MPVEPRGQAICVMINLVNRKREEPAGCGGGRQPSLNGTSRVTGDCHARICERLGVKIPGATRRGAISDGRPYRAQVKEGLEVKAPRKDLWRPKIGRLELE
jgi:hypothetical protein